jgi:hypothetical protein
MGLDLVLDVFLRVCLYVFKQGIGFCDFIHVEVQVKNID